MNELSTTTNTTNSVQIFDGNKSMYSSLQAETREEKLKLFSLINGECERLDAHIGEVLSISDIYAENVNFVDDETGEISEGVRIILVDENGVGYACASNGIFNSIKKLMILFGEPTWSPAIPVKVRQIKKGKKSVLTLQ